MGCPMRNDGMIYLERIVTNAVAFSVEDTAESWEMIDKELYDKAFVQKWCHGFEELKERAREYPLEKVAGITW